VLLRPEASLSLLINQRVSERCAVICGALEDREMADFFGDNWDHLDGGGAGADDRDTLAGESSFSLGHRDVWNDSSLKLSTPRTVECCAPTKFRLRQSEIAPIHCPLSNRTSHRFARSS
jgi:hypothetical protein